MPRIWKFKPGAKKRKRYENSEIQKAINAIKCGLSIRNAAKNLIYQKLCWIGI